MQTEHFQITYFKQILLKQIRCAIKLNLWKVLCSVYSDRGREGNRKYIQLNFVASLPLFHCSYYVEIFSCQHLISSVSFYSSKK